MTGADAPPEAVFTAAHGSLTPVSCIPSRHPHSSSDAAAAGPAPAAAPSCWGCCGQLCCSSPGRVCKQPSRTTILKSFGYSCLKQCNCELLACLAGKSKYHNCDEFALQKLPSMAYGLVFGGWKAASAGGLLSSRGGTVSSRLAQSIEKQNRHVVRLVSHSMLLPAMGQSKRGFGGLWWLLQDRRIWGLWPCLLTSG